MSLFSGKTLILVAFCSSSAFGNSQFPNNWIGRWTGEAQIRSAEEIRQPLQMTLDIQATDDPDVFEFSLQYEGEAIRRHTLVAKDRSAGHWILDENNGILIDSYYSNGVLRSLFLVNGKLIPFRYEKKRNVIVVDAPMFQAGYPRASGAFGFPVKSFSLINCQTALLRKSD